MNRGRKIRTKTSGKDERLKEELIEIQRREREEKERENEGD